MKVLLTLTLGLLLHFTVSAEKFYRATVVFTDGREAEGLATLPDNPVDETIRYKENDDAKVVKYKSEELARLVYPESDGNNVIFERVLAQKGPASHKTKIFWLRVAKRGFATLYFCDAKTAMGTGGGMIVGSDRYWFVKREDELSASIVSWQGYATNEAYFRRNASEYFKDDEQLATELKDKKFKREDIYKVLEEYNKWKEHNG